jgi:hypothetical protein
VEAAKVAALVSSITLAARVLSRVFMANELLSIMGG